SDISEIVMGTRAFAMVARYAEIYERSLDVLTPPMLRQVGNAAGVDVKTIAKAERLRTHYWQRVRRLFEDYDYLMLPVCGVAGFRRDGERPPYDAFFATYAISVVGLPAISVPCGLTHDGLPVGLQIVGRRFHEDRVLEAGAMYANSRSV
ncbi:MAG: amidase family protein, partial [Vulcanimicrobiaceae bacterium]